MLRRLLGIALCLSLPLATATNNRATDAAFAALLSMPGAEPANGSWDFPQPEGFSADNEQSLIAYLARQQKAGGDFNAYRHEGTLLHHAIRAGKPATALWLLQHGADPRLKAQGSDALALSVLYKLPQVRKALVEKYGLAPPLAQPPVKASGAPQPWPITTYRRIHDAVSGNIKSPAALDKALAALPAGELAGDYGAAFAAVQQAGNVPAESWRVLWRHLGRLPFKEYEAGYAAKIPDDQWPALIAAGYRNDSAEWALGCMVAESKAAELKMKWSALEKNFPDFRQVAARMVLHPYRIATIDGSCSSPGENEVKAKLDWLLANNAKAPVPGIDTEAVEHLKDDTKQALQQFTAKPADKPRLSSVQPQCEFTLDDVWLKRFATSEVPLDGISLVQIPGDAHCAVMANWTPRFDRPSGVTDNFTGPTFEREQSCPDVPESHVLWRRTKDGIVELEHEIDVSSFDFPAPVRDNVSGQLFYLDNGMRAGNCSGRPVLPFLYEWQRKGEQWRLALSRRSELREALFSQCSAAGGTKCEGIDWPTGDDPYVHMPFRAFLGKFGPYQRYEYLDALLQPDFDREKLRKIEAGPLPSTWVGEAISAVGESDLPLAEKRKRIAHLFYDHEQLARAMEETDLVSLVAWLPAEDWGPVIGVMRKYPYRYYVREVHDEAIKQGKQRLACELDNMRGLLCGETLAP